MGEGEQQNTKDIQSRKPYIYIHIYLQIHYI